MRQMSHTGAAADPPPPGDALDELRKQFPGRRIYRARRECDVGKQRTGDYYAATARPFTDKEIEGGGVKTAFAATPEQLRTLLAQQPDAPACDG